MNAISNEKICQYFKKDPNAFCMNEKGERRCRSVHYESQFRFEISALKEKVVFLKKQMEESMAAWNVDINFDFPPSADAYNKKGKGRTWKYNTSGIIVHKLGKRWDESFVLVFPLQIKNVKYGRHEIETAVGNYLIDKGVPILDYYSHNY